MADFLHELFSLRDRVAIVTGASSGIGRSIAFALARAGASVVIVARSAPALAETVRELGDADGAMTAVAADLAVRESLEAGAERAAAVYGEPDVLVNCAGINLRPPMGELTEQVWRQTMALNLDAPFRLGQRFGPGMARRGYGRIVNVSSQQAQRAFVDSGAYGASKGGLEALTRSQAEAWSPHGVTANALVPGFVMTPLNARLSSDPERLEQLAARTMVGRNGLADDFAGAAVFLAGPASAYVTGQAIHVDGGFSVH